MPLVMKFNSGLGIISRDCRINPDLSIEICVAINNMTISFVTGAKRDVLHLDDSQRMKVY